MDMSCTSDFLLFYSDFISTLRSYDDRMGHQRDTSGKFNLLREGHNMRVNFLQEEINQHLLHNDIKWGISIIVTLFVHPFNLYVMGHLYKCRISGPPVGLRGWVSTQNTKITQENLQSVLRPAFGM